MQRVLLLLGLAALLSVARADDQMVDRLTRDQWMRDQQPDENRRKSSPQLDPKRIINESASFLKEKEPEMTAEEYALYERVVTMLTTKPDFALRLLEGMMNEKEPPSPAFEFILGNAYYATGDNAKAEASYTHAVQRYPTFLRAWANLGVLYYTTGKFGDAIKAFTKCVTLGDRDPTTFGLLAYSLEQEKRVVQAEMGYLQALAGDPANTDWLEGLLRIYVEGKQYGRAEWLVKDLIKQRPKETRFWLAYANILLSQGRKVEAMALLEVMVGTGIAGPTELGLLADLYADQRMVPEAITTYERVMKLTPELGERKLLTLADLMTTSGNLPQAQRVLDALERKVSPAGRGAYSVSRAELLMAQAKWPDARRVLDELLQVEPLNGRALLALGKVYAAESNLPRAQLAFEAALQVPDSVYRASLELATLELRNRHYEKTVEYLEKALAIQKTAPVQDFLARVKPLLANNPDKS